MTNEIQQAGGKDNPNISII